MPAIGDLFDLFDFSQHGDSGHPGVEQKGGDQNQF
jgi:hypothetical protein